MMGYQTILFDIDNTLVNSADLIAETLQKAAKKVENVNVPVEEYRKLIGQPGADILRMFGVQDCQKVLDVYMVDFTQNMKKLAYFPQIEQVLDDLKQRHVKIGVVTSKNRYQFDKETRYFPMIAGLDIITTSDLTEKPKPSGEPLTYTLKQHHLNRQTTLYVGDSVYDMRSANEAKIDFGAAKWGALPDEEFEYAQHTLERPEDLLEIINSNYEVTP